MHGTLCLAVLLVLLVLAGAVAASAARRPSGGSGLDDWLPATDGPEGFYGLYPYQWPPYARYWRQNLGPPGLTRGLY